MNGGVCLFNAIVNMLREMNVKWNEPNSYGVRFLKKVCDVLWYTDSYHDTINEKAIIPDVFSRFQGYNCTRAMRKDFISHLTSWYA